MSDRARILLVEDDEDLRLLTSEILTFAGYEVRSACDGTTGLEMALVEPPDLVLCDVLMPGLDGRAVLQALRHDARTAAVPVVMCSARADYGTVELARAEGAAAYLVKPFTRRELLQCVSRQLGCA